jgi:hypothetical protein
MMATGEPEARRFLRHTLATLAYRAGKGLRAAPQGFGATRIAETSRTACEILGHISDLMEWALSMARGSEVWRTSPTGEWSEEVERFFASIGRLDENLASDADLSCAAERLFQGPIADALTHVGQLALLRRVAGSAVRGENYFRADIVEGRVGRAQSPARREFE